MVIDILSYLLMTILVSLGFTFLNTVLRYIKFMLILRIWFTHNSLAQLKSFALTMRWNIKTPVFFPSLPIKALWFNAHVPTPPSRMEELNANIVTFLTLFVLNFFLLPVLKKFGERLPSPQSMSSTAFLLMSFIHNVSPFERLYGTFPSYSNLKVFGCACFVLLHPHQHTKLEPRARLCCFLGYGTEHKGFRCWDPISLRLRISHHVTFWEHRMFSTLSSFHAFLFGPHLFFTNPSTDLFPTSCLSLHLVLYPYLSSLNQNLSLRSRIFHPSLVRILHLHRPDGLPG